MIFIFAASLNNMIYFAPLQGFTDYVYRKVYASFFSDVDGYFIPYISIKNEKIAEKYIREILPEKNPQEKAVPQVLAKDSRELLLMAGELKRFGYTEINLNMGCPYPMVTNRGKGAGLMIHPENLEKMLDDFFHTTNLKLSVKLRAGLNSPNEIEQVLPVLNAFPLTEIIFHPRIAKQLYKGEIYDSAFSHVAENCKHRLVYNGDIFSLKDFSSKKSRFPQITDWMLGRGILMNPFLPAEINSKIFSAEEKKSTLEEFHRHLFEDYMQKMDNPGNALNKMKQFWVYFSHNFEDQHKVLKGIKKIKSASDYLGKSAEIFNSFSIIE